MPVVAAAKPPSTNCKTGFGAQDTDAVPSGRGEKTERTGARRLVADHDRFGAIGDRDSEGLCGKRERADVFCWVQAGAMRVGAATVVARLTRIRA